MSTMMSPVASLTGLNTLAAAGGGASAAQGAGMHYNQPPTVPSTPAHSAVAAQQQQHGGNGAAANAPAWGEYYLAQQAALQQQQQQQQAVQQQQQLAAITLAAQQQQHQAQGTLQGARVRVCVRYTSPKCSQALTVAQLQQQQQQQQQLAALAAAANVGSALSAYEGLPIYLVQGATGLPTVLNKDMRGWAAAAAAAAANPAVAAQLLAPAGPKVDTSKHYHIFVGDLSSEVDNQTLLDAFKVHGEVSEAKVIRDPLTLKSKGYGFVAFPKREEAETALEQMNGQWVGRRAIRTNWATRKGVLATEKNNGAGANGTNGAKALNYDDVFNQTSATNTTVYVGGVANVEESALRTAFGSFGPIADIKTFPAQGFAFVKFENKEHACQAIVSLHQSPVSEQTIKCAWGRASETPLNPQTTPKQPPKQPPSPQRSTSTTVTSAGSLTCTYPYSQAAVNMQSLQQQQQSPQGCTAAAAAAAQQLAAAQQYWTQYYQQCYANNPQLWHSYWQQTGGQ